MATTSHTSRKQKKRTSPLVILLVLLIVGAVVVGIVLSRDPSSGGSTIGNSSTPLRITEYMSSNSGVIADSRGNCHDWIEISNVGSGAVSLAGCTITRDTTEGKLPSVTLQPGEYAVIFCDGTGKGDNLPFKLSAGGGNTLTFKDGGGALIERLITVELNGNCSAIRQEDDTFGSSTRPTPGFANDDAGFAAMTAAKDKLGGTLLLSEIMPANTMSAPDGDGSCNDYIEIVNKGSGTVDLSGYGLSDKQGVPFKWQFPDGTSLGAGKTLLVFCSGKGHSADPKELHASFRIGSAEATVTLCDREGNILDRCEINGAADDAAYLRDGGEWIATYDISPGFENTAEGIESFRKALDAKRGTGLRINEYMTRNNTVTCISGKCYDWIELYNGSGADINLAGYTVTDDTGDPKKYALSGTIKAGGYLVLYATGNAASGTYVQLPFKLDSDGGCFALYGPDGKLVDGVPLGGIPTDMSRGRSADRAGFVYFEKPTKGAANTTAGKPFASTKPVMLTAAGIFDDVAGVTVEIAGKGTIYYTLDGSKPTPASKRYTAPFELTATTAVRAMAVEDDAVPSDTVTGSYIINEHHTLDVVSVAADPEGLFSTSTGIYSLGPAADVYPYTGANFWKNWERPAHIELLCRDDEPGFSVDCGIRIFGGMSRMYEKKAFAVKFRDSYGCGTLEYPVFENRDFDWYESLLLRCSGQDRLRSIMKDVVATSLIDETGDVEVQSYRPVILYINGQYWGVYYIREKVDENFLSAHENVAADSVDLLQGNYGVNAGSNEDYKELLSYIKSHNLANSECYRYVTDRVDVQSFCDYLISEIYFANNDAGNVRFYRSSDETSDGKWRWIIYDTDLCWGASNDRIWYYINPAGTGAGQNFNTTMINGLLKNADFRKLFLERLEYLMKNVYSTEKVLARIDEIYTTIKPEIVRNFARWEHPDIDWEGNVEVLRNFAKGRQAAVLKEFLTSSRVKAAFGYTDAEIRACFE